MCAFASFATGVKAQTLHVRISVTSVAPARIRIDAELPKATNVFSFRNNYGGVLGLGERIERLEAVKLSGESVPVQELAPGEFQTAEKFTRFRYDVRVAEPAPASQMSHISWLNRDHGLLMLADLLPASTNDSASFTSALVSVAAPPGVPADRVAILRRAFDATTKDPEFLADVEKQKVELFPITGEKVADLVRRIYSTPQDVVETAKQISSGR